MTDRRRALVEQYGAGYGEVAKALEGATDVRKQCRFGVRVVFPCLGCAFKSGHRFDLAALQHASFRQEQGGRH